MDKLAQDAKKALEAGMSYGQWKATQPIVHHLPRKVPKGQKIKVCKNCGKEFMTSIPKKVFCDDNCRRSAEQKAYHERKKGRDEHGSSI